MTVYKNWSNDQYKKWLYHKIQDNYGISEEAIADWFMSTGTPAISAYGVTKANLLSDYIPKLKDMLGGGYVFFLTYTVAEGGGAGNWINHYAGDTGSNGMECLIDDCNYLLGLNKGYPVALSAPEVGGTAVEDNAGEANKVYQESPDDSIALVYMPSTMAGNAWVYCTAWCEANQGSAPPAVYFGNPYDQSIQVIIDLGGDPFGDGGDYTPLNRTSTPTGSTSSKTSSIEVLKKMLKEVNDELKKGTSNRTVNHSTYTNENVTIKRTFNNTLNASLSKDFIDKLAKKYAEQIGKSGTSNPSVSSGGSSTGEHIGDWGEASEKVKGAIESIRGLRGQRIGSGQCYALTGYYIGLISNATIDYSVSNAYGFPMMTLIGSGVGANSIGQDWNFSDYGWKVMPPDPQYIVVGCIINFQEWATGAMTTYQNGHTGMVTGIDGTTIEFTQQNLIPLTVSIDLYDKNAICQTASSIIMPPTG